MTHYETSRRDFLKQSAAVASAGLVAPYIFTSAAAGAKESKNGKLTVAAIGVGGRNSR